ncbi:MAG: hypothetical protein K8S99_05905 [Planctomycetes bacterium]|nr:hypothetical protein [Planctomycetota bacterium]
MTRQHRTYSPQFGTRRAAGLTLLELLMSLVITGVIGVAIASMLFAASKGTSTNSDMRSLVIKQKVVGGRFDAAVRGSSMVLASGSNYLVLWMNDSRANGAPDLSELRRIEYDSTTHRITSYRMPASWTQTQIDANEVNYTLADNFNTRTTSVKGSASFPAEVWSNSVYGWTFTLDSAVPDTALISYRLLVQNGSQQATLVSAVALRN